MATTNLKRITANILADYISAQIPGLTGKVNPVVAGPEVNLPCLALRIIPDLFTFDSAYDLEVYWNQAVDDGKIILDVGQWTGTFTLELYATSPAERELYEQAILDLFIASEWSPGTLYLPTPNLTIMNYVSVYQDEARFALNDENWIEEMSFEAKRYCFITIQVDYPALITRDAATLTDLRVMLSTDAEAVITDPSQIPLEDQGSVTDDGGLVNPGFDPGGFDGGFF